jgi:hypothetical protein
LALGPEALIRFLERLDMLQSKIIVGVKWGSWASLHGGNPEFLMSALGQKRTALPLKADIS